MLGIPPTDASPQSPAGTSLTAFARGLASHRPTSGSGRLRFLCEKRRIRRIPGLIGCAQVGTWKAGSMSAVLPDGEPVPPDGALPPAALGTLARQPFGIYVHVPF